MKVLVIDSEGKCFPGNWENIPDVGDEVSFGSPGKARIKGVVCKRVWHEDREATVYDPGCVWLYLEPMLGEESDDAEG